MTVGSGRTRTPPASNRIASKRLTPTSGVLVPRCASTGQMCAPERPESTDWRRSSRRGTTQAGALAAGDELDRHLAARLVDHLVAEHHGAIALVLGGDAVGLEDVVGPVELLLGGAELLVEDRDLVGVQRPLAV